MSSPDAEAMTSLTRMHCVSCRGGEPAATAEEQIEYSKQTPGWSIVAVEGVQRLSRRFAFRNFAEALAFTDRVGALAEAEGHHPQLVTEWGGVGVSWWTHKIRGLHRNDFIMAARTDELFAAPGS